MTKTYHIQGQSYSLSALRQKANEVEREASLPEFELGVWSFIAEWLDENETVVLQTSGSTGTPQKMVMPKRYMRQSAQMTLDFFGLSPNDTALCCLPASYIAGKMMIVRALEGELNLLLAEAKGNPLNGLNYAIDFVAMVPLQVENVLNDQAADLNRIKHLILGGAPISKPLEDRLQASECAIWHTYGMTETVSHIAVRRVNGPEKTSSYSPMKDVKISLDDRQCLQIEAPLLFPSKVQAYDIVEIDDCGRFTFLGRYDNVINSGGVKISPELIEKKIATFITPRFIISSMPDERLGQCLILVIESPQCKIDEEDLMARLKAVLSPYEMPKSIRYIAKFAETSSGKVKR